MLHNDSSKKHLDRVTKDISQLRQDVASLFSHTTRNAIPDGARDLTDYSRDRLSAGGEFAASQLRYIRNHPGQSSVGILGGILILGAVGAGIYYLCKSDSGKHSSRDSGNNEHDHPRGDIELPPYIS